MSLSATPKFSVIIPTLQEESVLARTLCQFSQDLKERYGIEVIVSDGGSSDATLQIAKKYADSIVEAEPNVRQTIALGRNRGAAVAKGSVLMFLDADVLIDGINHFFETLGSMVSKNEIVGMTCNVRVYQTEERTFDRLFHQFYNKYFYFLNIVGIGMGRGECQVIRKEAFEASGKYNERMAAGEDFDMFTRLKKMGRVYFAHSLTVRESPRRFRKFGYIYMSGLWFINALSIWLFRKPVVNQWKVVR